MNFIKLRIHFKSGKLLETHTNQLMPKIENAFIFGRRMRLNPTYIIDFKEVLIVESLGR